MQATRKRVKLGAAFLLLLTCAPLHAQNRVWSFLKDDAATSWDDARKNCAHAKDTKVWSDIEGCAVGIYDLKPLGLQAGSIAPGGSIALGLGLRYTIMHPSSRPDHVGDESDLLFRAMYSLTNFYLMDARYDFRMPAIGQADATNSHRFEDQIVFSVFASRVNLATQDFYGIGPNTSLSEHAVYRQLEDRAGTWVDWPILSWLAAGGGAQWLAPSIKGVSGDSFPSVAQLFGNSGAPGVVSQPYFMNYQAYVRVHTPTKARQTWNYTDTRFTYEHFTDLGAGTYTFDRISGWASTSFDIRHDTSELRPPWWKNALCEPITGGQCRFGKIKFTGLATASYVDSGRSVPFFFQPTLGGTDVNGLDTLRGLVDYRLRAPNRVLFQSELDHNIAGPVGIYGFYDVGKVALLPRGLELGSMRHDIGVGIYLKVEDKIVVRGFIGFGGGEGSHPNFKTLSTSDPLWASQF